jgi:DNA-binding transcriptional LysR family regulator
MHTLHAMFSSVFSLLPQPQKSSGRHKVEFTEAGRVLKVEARRVVQQTQDVVRRAQVPANSWQRSIRRELSFANSFLSYRVTGGC